MTDLEKHISESSCFGVLYYDALGVICPHIYSCEVSLKCKKAWDNRIISVEAEKHKNLSPELMSIFKRELEKFAKELESRLVLQQQEKDRVIEERKKRSAKAGVRRKRHVRSSLALNNELHGHRLCSSVLEAISNELFDHVFCSTYINVKSGTMIYCRLQPRKMSTSVLVQKILVNPLAAMGFTVFAVPKSEQVYMGDLVGYVQLTTQHHVEIFSKTFSRYYGG